MKRGLLFAEATPQTLGMARVLVFGLLALWLLQTDPAAAARLPEVFREPMGFGALVPEAFWSALAFAPVMIALHWSAVACAVWSALGGPGCRAVAPLAVLLVLLLDTWGKMHAGYANHSQAVLLFIACVLAVSPCSGGFVPRVLRRDGGDRPDAASPRYGAPLVLVVWVLCSCYAALGLHRLLRGGMEIFTGDPILFHFAVQGGKYSPYGFSCAEWLLAFPALYPVWKAGFLSITLLEVSAPACLFFPRFRIFWVLVMAGFHFSALFLMNIFFGANLLLIIGLLGVLPAVAARRPRTRLSGASLAAALLLFAVPPAPASEVQRHGLTFEGWVAGEFFGGVQSDSPTAKWDIPARANRDHGGVPVNPKAIRYGEPVMLGDALRQYDIDEPFLLIVGFWRQEGVRKNFVQSLAAHITPERWRELWAPVTRADVEELDRLVKDTSRTVEEVRREVLQRKKEPPFTEAVIQLNPKVDRSQRRLQCSISFVRLFEHLAPGKDRGALDQAEIFGRPIPSVEASPPRSFAPSGTN